MRKLMPHSDLKLLTDLHGRRFVTLLNFDTLLKFPYTHKIGTIQYG